MGDVGTIEWKLTPQDDRHDDGEPCQPAGEDELCADSAAHEDGVGVRGLAEGHVPVVGHGCEEKEFWLPGRCGKSPEQCSEQS